MGSRFAAGLLGLVWPVDLRRAGRAVPPVNNPLLAPAACRKARLGPVGDCSESLRKGVSAMFSRRGDALLAKLQRASLVKGTDQERDACCALARHEKTLQRLAEESCNGHPCQGNPHIDVARCAKLQEEWDRRIEKQTEQHEKRCAYLATTLGCEAVFNGDPRGAVVKLAFPGHSGDSWGGDGFVID